jgi:hypothetical protein
MIGRNFHISSGGLEFYFFYQSVHSIEISVITRLESETKLWFTNCAKIKKEEEKHFPFPGFSRVFQKHLSQVLWIKNFISEQGYDTGAAIVHQDNKSTITLAEKGKSVNNRTRHVSIRYFFVHDRISSGEIKIQFTGTEEMVADFFSKPLQGNLFEKFRKIIMNLA